LFDYAKELEAKAGEAQRAALRLEKKAPKAKPERSRLIRTLARRRLNWFEKFRWFFTSEGRLAVGGRDAQSNSALIGHHLDENDVIYHADLFGSPFFVLKGGREQSDEEIREVAQATASFSSAWKTGLGSADAYWVSPDQVSTAASSGEYLPRGSYVIRGKKNFVTKNIIEIAVGVDGEGRVVAGPEGAIRKHCARYLVLRPHREKSSDTAKRVLKDLSEMSGSSTDLTLDNVLRILPSGGGRVVRKGQGPQTFRETS
jgi:hypothetical protein